MKELKKRVTSTNKNPALITPTLVEVIRAGCFPTVPP